MPTEPTAVYPAGTQSASHYHGSAQVIGQWLGGRSEKPPYKETRLDLVTLQGRRLIHTFQTIIVERQLTKPDKTGVKILRPKTTSGKRTIDLDTFTIQVLMEHYEHQHADA